MLALAKTMEVKFTVSGPQLEEVNQELILTLKIIEKMPLIDGLRPLNSLNHIMEQEEI